jgi:hypothetical protein
MKFKFEPPLCIPGHGEARIQGIEDLDGEPPFVTVEILDETRKSIALGLYRKRENDSVYVLESGTAYRPIVK